MKYSVTTVTLPELTMLEQAKLLSKLGYDGIELRVRRCSDEIRAKAEPAMWGYHVNDVTPENFKEKAPEINKILSDYGLKLAGLATNMSCNDMEQFKNVLEGAVEAKSPFIRLGASAGFNAKNYDDYHAIFGETVAGYARCLELTRGTGIKLILEMHGNTIHPSASLAYRIVSNFSPKDVGVIYDPQNMVRDGYETPAIAIQLLGDYLAHCHFGAHRPVAGAKNENGTTVWTWERCPLSEGLFDFENIFQIFKRINYSHFITVEDFGSQPAEEKFAEAIAYFKKLETL